MMSGASLSDHRKFLLLRMAGFSIAEASGKVGISQYQLRRFDASADYKIMCAEFIEVLCDKYRIEKEEVYELIEYND